jgi:hypothetical protein
MNTWIRIDTGLADHMKVRRLAGRIFSSANDSSDSPHDAAQNIPNWVRLLAAEGLLVNLWSKVADHQEDGDLSEREDDELELWARWRGEPARFATAFRELFTNDASISSWDEYQGKLIERRRKDREKKKLVRSFDRSAGQSARQSEGQSAGQSAAVPALQYSTEQYGKAAAAGAEGAANVIPINPVVDLGYLNRCVDTLNAAMDANPNVHNPRPVLALNQMDAVRWDRDGIPLDLALAVILERGASYKASGRNKQVSSLAYFDGAVRDRWAALQGSRMASGSDVVAPSTMREAILAKRGF